MHVKDAIVTDHPFPNAFSPEMLLVYPGGSRVSREHGTRRISGH